MTRSEALAPPSTAPAVPSRRARRPWRRMAQALAQWLRRTGLAPRLDEDGRWLAGAASLEELERRQRRLERHGSPLPPIRLP